MKATAASPVLPLGAVDRFVMMLDEALSKETPAEQQRILREGAELLEARRKVHE